MKKICVIIGILAVVVAKFFALIAWLINTVLPYGEFVGRGWMLISQGCRLLDLLLLGLGIILIGVAVLMGDGAKGTQPAAGSKAA
jgi:hypothetical protein